MSGAAWIVIALMIAFNAVFAAYEIALASVSITRLQSLARGKRFGARAATFMKRHMEASLAVVQLGVTMVGAIAAATGGAGAEEAVVPYLESRFGFSEGLAESISLAIVVVPLGTVTIVVGELIPKVFALRNKEWVCLVLSPVMRTFYFAAFPVVWLLENLVSNTVRWSERLWRPKPHDGEDGKEPLELRELRALAEMARASRLITGREEGIIQGASRLSLRPIREIVVPAADVATLHLQDRTIDALEAARLDMHTRYPVCERAGDPQSICGYVNFKDLVLQPRVTSGEPLLRVLVRELPSIHPDVSIAESLERMFQGHAQMAAVRESDGTVLGIVALEDILEELVGDIQDEYDKLPDHIQSAGNGWVIGGGVAMTRVRQITGRPLQATLKDSPRDSLNNWILAHVHNPKPAMELSSDGLTIRIRKVRRKRILEAQLIPVE
jgi:magnesium and cobalt exporter, CNNM family